MGKPTGFLEFDRELPADRSPEKRVEDWDEFHLHMTEEKLREQGSRCMDCGVPFCHTGVPIGGPAAEPSARRMRTRIPARLISAPPAWPPSLAIPLLRRVSVAHAGSTDRFPRPTFLRFPCLWAWRRRIRS